tara:strand:+ start:172 stop:1308 length:1137 start_codon:yes stop_codon:yes gene_type:complete
VFKIFFLNALVFAFLLEAFSFIGVQFNIFSYPSIPSYGNTSTFEGSDWRNEKELWGAWHKKNFTSNSSKSCFDVTYKTNNIGARDNKDYSKQSESIILLGDSFGEGVGVNFEDTFTAKIKPTNMEVFNFSSAGDFGPLQEYIIYKELASTYNHKEVIVFFLPANDFTDNSYKYQQTLFGKRYRPYFQKKISDSFDIYYPDGSLPSDRFPSDVRKNSFKLKSFLIDYFYSANILRQFRLIILGANPEIQKVFNKSYGYNFDDEESIEGVLYYYSKLFEEIPDEIYKTLIIIPTDRDLREIKSNKWSYQKLDWYKGIKKITKDNNVNLIDLALDNNIASEALLEKGINSWFLKCDGHWNKNGHSYAAMRYLELKNKKEDK